MNAPPREDLRETVRRAVAGATSEEEFFDRLAAAGLLIRKRVAPSGDLLGYKVALPDDRNGEKEPVFYAGSTLAPDLSLPRIRERWAIPAQVAVSADDSRPEQPAPAGRDRSRVRAAPSLRRHLACTTDRRPW